MKIRNFTRPNQAARTITREGNVICIYVDQGKDWRREDRVEHPTVASAKAFMNRPVI
jgi:hypothetical protein